MGPDRRLRQMEPRDLPALWLLTAAQNRRDGTSYPFPPVFEMDESKPGFGQRLPNVVEALVTETRTPAGRWRVKQGHVFLRTIEEMSFGGGRQDMEFSAAHIPLVAEQLKRMGYDDLHTLVPRDRADHEHEELLGSYGLTRIDHRLAHFFRML